MTQTIAFIGCGAMGAPIAERLIDAGYTVRLFDPRTEAMAPLVSAAASRRLAARCRDRRRRRRSPASPRPR
jgi:3-hydroxyisobutyrate dehydrogenase-like beta-hydroxyacid dehydrogenase